MAKKRDGNSQSNLTLLRRPNRFGDLKISRVFYDIVKWNTNPGNADRNAAGLNAGKSVGPHNDMNGIGDHVRNGADGGIMLPKCDTGDRRPVVGGDGEHRRFLMSATIVTVLRRILHKSLTILCTCTIDRIFRLR